MTTLEINQTLIDAACGVLETMFFADALPSSARTTQHADPVTCRLHATGVVDGVFRLAIDRDTLRQLCGAFYGDDHPDRERQQELACELTNMIAGSTLSRLLPDRACPLSAPSLCTFQQHLHPASAELDASAHALVMLSLEGGLLSVSCCLGPR